MIVLKIPTILLIIIVLSNHNYSSVNLCTENHSHSTDNYCIIKTQPFCPSGLYCLNTAVLPVRVVLSKLIASIKDSFYIGDRTIS